MRAEQSGAEQKGKDFDLVETFSIKFNFKLKLPAN
jgi:hypothetical protein